MYYKKVFLLAARAYVWNAYKFKSACVSFDLVFIFLRNKSVKKSPTNGSPV